MCCPTLGFSPDTVNRIVVWGLFGIGFDLLFGYTGLLSFGQAAFYGTGGFVAAYLLTNDMVSSVLVALVLGTAGAMLAGLLVGLVALRRTGIYFAMITVAIAQVFFFLENSPLADFTGGENGLPGVPAPVFSTRLRRAADHDRLVDVRLPGRVLLRWPGDRAPDRPCPRRRDPGGDPGESAAGAGARPLRHASTS